MDRTQWFPFMVGVGLAFFGMIASGVPPWMAGTAALLIAVGSGIWLTKPPEPPVREVTNWSRVAELEHDTGIYDLYLKLGADGHSEGVGDACRQCARVAVTQDMHRVGGYAALYDLDPAAEPGVHPGRGLVPEYSMHPRVEVWVQGPCPFCGNKIDRKGYYDPYKATVTVGCSKCQASLQTKDLSGVPEAGAKVIVSER